MGPNARKTVRTGNTHKSFGFSALNPAQTGSSDKEIGKCSDNLSGRWSVTSAPTGEFLSKNTAWREEEGVDRGETWQTCVIEVSIEAENPPDVQKLVWLSLDCVTLCLDTVSHSAKLHIILRS